MNGAYSVCEEIADVLITMEQLQMIFSNADEVEEIKEEKIHRLENRLRRYNMENKQAKETSVFEEVRKTVEDICYKISPDSQCQERCPLAIYGSCMRKMFDEMLRKVEDWNAKFYGK